MKRIFLILLVATMATGFFATSCKDDETTSNPTPSEFVADNTTFAGFKSWTLTDTKKGTDPALKDAHAGNDTTAKRMIYIKNNQKLVNGLYPVGTLIVKQLVDKDGKVIMNTAMAKRGNNFDAANNNWEYFVIMDSGAIMVDAGTTMRGKNLMNGMCVGCHNVAKAKDFIFTAK